jgi:hypothetical protein
MIELDCVDGIELVWLSAGWTQFTRYVFQLAGRDRVGLTLGQLQMVKLGEL